MRTAAAVAVSGVRRPIWAARIPFPELFVFPPLACAVALPALLRGQLIGRGGILHEYSLYAFVAHAIRAGHLPQWNPYTVSGNPGLADPASNVFYPPAMALLMLLPVGAALNAVTLVQMVLAAVFMHVYLGGLGLSRPARFVGALIYMLAAIPAWRILAGDIPRMGTYGCVPLVFYFIEEIACGRRGTGAALLGGVTIACPLLAGEPQNFTYLCVAAAAYAGLRLASAARERPRAWRAGRTAALLAALFLFGAGFASVQVLPTLEQFVDSNRPGFNTDFAMRGSIPLVGLVSLLAPRFFGHQIDDQTGGNWGEQSLNASEFYPHASSLYTGFFTIALVFAALPLWRSRWHVRFFAVMAATVLWAALGRFGYLYQLVVYVPLLRSFRDIENINVLLPVCTAVLAAIGFECYHERGHPADTWQTAHRSLRLVIAGCVALLGLTILMVRSSGLELLLIPAVRAAIVESGSFVAAAWAGTAALLWARTRYDAPPRWLTGAAIAFLAADLLYTSGPLIAAGTDAARFEQPDAATRVLAGDRTLYRVSGLYDRGPVFELQDIQGEPSLLSARYMEYTDVLQGYALDRQVRAEGPHGVILRNGFKSPLLDLLNVKYLVLKVPPDEISVYTRPHVFPRALAASGYRVLHDRARILETLSAADYDPHRYIVLEREPALPAGFGAAPKGAGPPAAVDVTSYEENAVSVRVDFPRPAFLLLNDLFYPEWRADIDGAPATIYRANYLFRAVAVPAGRHEIHFVYRDRMLALGAALALLASCVGVGAWIVERRRASIGRSGGSFSD